MNLSLRLAFKPARAISFFLFFFITSNVFAQTATLTTDQPDYPPGSTVILSGQGFQPGETVTLQVLHVDGGDNLTSPEHIPWTVTADASGNFTATWYIPTDEDELGATLRATADGQSSGLHAEVIFTDANLNSVSVGAASGSLTYGAGGVITYTVSVKATGSGAGPTNVTLSTSGLPAAGVTVFWSSGSSSFVSPNIINFTGAATIDVTLTLLVQNNTKIPASSAFTVTATAGGTTKSANGSFVINPLAITGNITANNKAYDGTTAATIATRTLTGVLFSDNVTYSGGTATFANKTVGTAKTVSATGLSLTGPDAGNYTVNTTAATTADITAKALTGAITVANKVYDGTTAATISTRTLTGVVSGDNVTYTGGTAAFSDKNAGNGKTVNATGLTLTGTDAGNYTVNASAATTANITPKTLTASVTVSDKVYNASTTANISSQTVVGAIAGDDVSITGGIANFSSANVGTGITVNVINMTLTGADAANYTTTGTATTTANITAKTVTVAITAANKVYDGNTSVTLISENLVGVEAADVSKLNLNGGSASFDNKNVGTGKTVTSSGYSLAGSAKSNYILNPTSATTTADITPRALTVTASGVNRVYDGTTTATVTLNDNRVSGDVITDAYLSATFANKNAGTNKQVAVTGISISGADAGNYTLQNTTANTTATISRKALTITAAGINKVYDGTVAATVTLSDNRIAGDVLADAYASAAFADKNVGTGKTVTATGLSISGTDAGNYTANTTATTTANITALGITGAITVSDKVYDGSNTATILTRTLTGAIGGDAVSYTGGTATFDNKNVGTGKTVSATGLSLTGADAGNYTVNATATTAASITALGITGSVTASDKVYDGNNLATILIRALTGAIGGDAVSYTGGTATFDTKNVGTGKTVTATGLSLTGADAGNYTVNATATTTADITALGITGSVTADNKVYDGNTSATILTRTLAGAVGGDAVSYTGGTATFDNKNVGTGKTVSATGLSLTGADAGNYTVNATASTTADITALGITGAITVSDKVYDGNNSAAILTRTLTGEVGGDAVSYTGGTATFDNKNVGTGKTVSATGLSLSGADAGNYTVNATATTTADITALGITGSVTADNKVYDGNTSATILTRTLTGTVGGDAVSYTGGTATFDNKNVGTGKTVSATGLSLTGADAGNYTVNATATTTANIAALGITGAITASNKVYDGNTSATILTRTLAGAVGGDAVSYSGGTATFDNKNVGTGKTVSASGLSLTGADAGNYTVNTTTTTTANITALGITGSVTAGNKVYDGNTTATILTRTLAGAVGGDAVSYTGGTATFDNKNVGTGKTVSATGLSLTGADAGNYTVNVTATTTANITALGITGSVTAGNKVYDGNTTAAILTRTLAGTIGGDVVSYTGGAATFTDKNVGTGKTVTATGLSLAGTDAGNYTVNTTATTTADITAKSVTAAIVAANKSYDGTTAAAATGSIPTGIVAGDIVTVNVINANFANATVGTWTVTATVALGGAQGGNYSLTSTMALASASITPLGVTTSVVGTPNPQQYSDQVTFCAKITGGAPLVSGGPQAAQTVTFKVGTQIIATNVPLVVSGADLKATYTTALLEPSPFGTTPTGQMAPGARTVTAVINSPNPNFGLSSSTPTTSLTITQEQARVTYTGGLLVATSSSSATTATVTLSATIQDITAVPIDVAFDAYPGDIRNATVTFNIDGIDKATVPIGLVNTADAKTGTAVYTWTGAGLGEHTVIIKVNGYYTNAILGDNSLVMEVYQPNGDFITGGGYLVLTNSNGLKAGDPGTKNNFGFNIKYNKGCTNLQGTINTIVRRMEGGVLHVYQVKGNSMTSLSVNPNSAPPTAVFNGKANITDITNPLSPVTVDGNATLQVSMTDAGDPGSSDQIGITVFNKSGGMWFTSNWNGTSTVQQTLGGGNLVVHSSTTVTAVQPVNGIIQTTGAQPLSLPTTDMFEVKVSDNPTETYFTLHVKSNTDRPIDIRVFNMRGKQVEQVSGAVGEPIRVGQTLAAGVYVLQVSQGNHLSIIKVIKI